MKNQMKGERVSMHVYLTEEKIEQALKAHVITKREAEELTHKMNRCLQVKKQRSGAQKCA